MTQEKFVLHSSGIRTKKYIEFKVKKNGGYMFVQLLVPYLDDQWPIPDATTSAVVVLSTYWLVSMIFILFVLPLTKRDKLVGISFTTSIVLAGFGLTLMLS